MKKSNKKINLSHQYIYAVAHRYLERYASTEANLKFILQRKVRRIITGSETENDLSEQSDIWIDEIVEQYLKQNIVNDRLYAKARAHALINSGNSIAVIKNKLRLKGVSTDLINETIEQASQDNPNINLQSAIKYARKRRFGSFRLREKGENTDKKESGAMARAGFSYAETKQVLKATREEFEDILYEN